MEEINQKPDDLIVCPFCGDDGYDKPGLIYHFTYCEEEQKARSECLKG